MQRNRLFGVTVAIVAALVVAVLLDLPSRCFRSEHSIPEQNGVDRASDGLPIERVTERWVQTLREGNAEVAVRRLVSAGDGATSERELGTIIGMGPMTSEEAQQTRLALAELCAVRRKWLDREQSKFEASGDPFANLEFAKRLADYEEAVASTKAVDLGSYYLQRQDHFVPALDGVRCIGTSLLRGGEPVFVTTVVEVAKNPALAAALAYQRIAEEQVQSVVCEEFNRLPLEKRVALVEEYRQSRIMRSQASPQVDRYFRAGLRVTETNLLTKAGQ